MFKRDGPFFIDVYCNGYGNATKSVPHISWSLSVHDENKMDEKSDEVGEEDVCPLLSGIQDKNMFIGTKHELISDAPKFRKKLFLYNMMDGYMLTYVKNDVMSVTVVCAYKVKHGCGFRIYGYVKFKIESLFGIEKIIEFMIVELGANKFGIIL